MQQWHLVKCSWDFKSWNVLCAHWLLWLERHHLIIPKFNIMPVNLEVKPIRVSQETASGQLPTRERRATETWCQKQEERRQLWGGPTFTHGTKGPTASLLQSPLHSLTLPLWVRAESHFRTSFQSIISRVSNLKRYVTVTQCFIHL